MSASVFPPSTYARCETCGTDDDRVRCDALERSIRYLLPMLSLAEIERVDAELVRVLRDREEQTS